MNIEQLYPILAALLISVASYLISYINNKKLKEKVTTIEEALQSDEATYYIYCPTCKAKIELNKVKILVDKQEQKNKESKKAVISLSTNHRLFIYAFILTFIAAAAHPYIKIHPYLLSSLVLSLS